MRPKDSPLRNKSTAICIRHQVMEVILVVTIKTLSNYINHLTEPDVNPELLALL